MKAQYITIDDEGKYYYSDKKMTLLHHEDGPACEYVDGTKFWYLNDKCHREDGPAIEYSNGHKLWYFDGKNITQEEHACLTKKVPTININGKEFTLEELNSLIKTA